MSNGLSIERPRRWDRPFGPDMTEDNVDRILACELLRDIDPDQFPENQSLREIVRNDSRIVRFKPGDIIVRAGDYGSSVFAILEGTVRVVMDEIQDSRLGGKANTSKRSWVSALSQLWRNPRMPEVRDVASYQGGDALSLRGEATSARTFLKDVASFLRQHDTVALSHGHAFGEIAALSRAPRTATIFAESEVVLMEMRWQGLRDIRRRDKMVRHLVDSLYRDRRLATQLRESSLFAHLDDRSLDTVAQQALFETHGEFEWFSSYKRVASEDTTQVLKHEPLITEQGAYLDGLILICSGFARVTQKLDHGERTVGYLSRNDAFGLEEIVRHRSSGAALLSDRSLRAIGYVDVIRIPTAIVEELIIPKLTAENLHNASAQVELEPWRAAVEGRALEQPLFDFFVDNRTINGTATMLIDMDRCVGCDDCVRACASAHDNNPRFIRQGRTHDRVQVVNACMHCVDPVCMIGCPTGAIGQSSFDGRVMIDDRTCIGCGTCANSCPYNNIQLVEIRDQSGQFINDRQTGTPILKAAKCDLCFGQLGGPACQRACPHDALIRIDMRDQAKLAAWVHR